MEDHVTTALMQNPAAYSTSPFCLDHDETLLVNPLRFQPPRNVITKMLDSDVLQLQWLIRMPLWIECIAKKAVEQRVTVDMSFDVVASHLHPFGVDGEHTTIRMMGTFVSEGTHNIRSVSLRENEELRCALCVGCEFVRHDHLRCDINDDVTLASFESYWKSNRDRLFAVNPNEDSAKRVGMRKLSHHQECIKKFLLDPVRSPPFATLRWSFLHEKRDSLSMGKIVRVCSESGCFVA